MSWTMLTIVVNLAGGQPVVLPGYTYTSEEACNKALYETRNLKIAETRLATTSAIVSGVCAPVDVSLVGSAGEE